MKKKPAKKVEESPTVYGAKKATSAAVGLESKNSPTGQIRYATLEQVRKSTEKVFRVHHELFRKLAQ